MRDCNQSAQTNATLSSILEAILNQSEKLNDQVIPLDSACFLVGTENMVLTPVVTMVDGVVTTTQYFNESGVLHTGVAPIAASPCDCPCPECDVDDNKACLFVDLFDVDDGLLQAGETTQYEIGTNAGSQTIVHDYTTSSDGTNKSTWYTPIMALLNGLADWSVELVSDTLIGNNEKPTYRITHTGSSADTLKITKTPNGDVYTVVSDGAGNITGSTDDSGSGQPFGSDPFDHPACTIGVDFPSNDILWRVDNPDASWSQMTDWGFDSGSLPNGDSGTGLTNFEATLTGVGYIVTNAGNSPLIVKEAATTGKPTNFKWVNTNGQDFVNDWVLV